MAEEQTFEDWIAAIGGITENGRSKLEKATIVSLVAINLLTEEDIDEIRLGLGDRVIFKAGWRKLLGVQEPTKASPTIEQILPEDPPLSTTSVRFTLSDVAELLKKLPTAPVAPVASTSQEAPQVPQGAHSRFGDQSAVTALSLGKNKALRDLAASLGHQAPADSLPLHFYSREHSEKGERCLLPINFATVLGGFVIIYDVMKYICMRLEASRLTSINLC
jgi:hypothetical protein